MRDMFEIFLLILLTPILFVAMIVGIALVMLATFSPLILIVWLILQAVT